jgi:hypothetical protein
MTQSQARIAGFGFLAAFVVLQAGVWDSPDADLFGLTVPLWLLGLVFYVLGAGAAWAAEHSKSGG